MSRARRIALIAVAIVLVLGVTLAVYTYLMVCCGPVGPPTQPR